MTNRLDELENKLKYGLAKLLLTGERCVILLSTPNSDLRVIRNCDLADALAMLGDAQAHLD